jgi:DNA modification methylase
VTSAFVGQGTGTRSGGPTWRIDVGDCREVLAALPDESVHAVVTSPPYFGLRDYGVAAQIGLEATPEQYVAALVEVFRGVRPVLRTDGTVWLNLGDSYATRWSSRRSDGGRAGLAPGVDRARHHAPPAGYKNKDLIGIPWMVAFALRADGWYLRSEIIWHKPNPMPESVNDRPTRAHEQVFLLARSERYAYDAAAIRTADKGADHARNVLGGQPSLEPSGGLMAPHRGLRTTDGRDGLGANKRSVWSVATRPFADAHFATFPPELVEPCVLAGAPELGVVLDPFAGAGTTGLVALRARRSFIGVELNPEYAALARRRIHDDSPLLNGAAEEVPDAA